MQSHHVAFSGICLLAINLSTGCGGESAVSVDTVERSDSAGIEIVLSRSEDRPLDWSSARVLTIGGDDDGAAAFGSLFNDGVAVGGDGSFVLLDAMSQRVLLFDRNGSFVRELGRKGGGPGEMEWPNSIAVAEGTISVYDLSKRGAIRFAADGTVLPTQLLPPLHGNRMAVADGRTWGVFAERDGSDSPTTLLLRGIGTDTVELGRVVQPATGMVEFPNCAVRINLPPLLAPAIEWNAGAGMIAWSAGPEYSVNLSDGRTFRVIRRDLPLQPLTTRLAAAEVGDTMRIRFGSGACAIPPEDVVTARGIAEHVPAVRDIALAPNGMIFIARGVGPRASWLLDVFDTGGAYLGTLPEGFPFPRAFRDGGEIVAIERDELDRSLVVVYRVPALAEAAVGR